MKKIIIAISSIWLLTVSSAMSMEFRPSVGISGNMGVYAATGTEKNYNEAGTAVDTTTEEHGAFVAEYASIFLEASLNDMVSIGVDYVPMDFETPENVSQEDQSNEKRVSARFDHLTTLYAKLNVPLGGTYLKVGYSHADVTSNEAGGGDNSYGYARLFRGSTAIGQGDQATGSQVNCSFQCSGRNFTYQGYRTDPRSFEFLDSPNTTSATTYKVNITSTSDNIYLNRSATVDTSNAFTPEPSKS